MPNILLVSLCLLLSAPTLLARQIIWQSSRGVHETSGGSALDGTYIFELGIFTEPFVPNRDNVSEWALNWQTADRAFYDTINRAFTKRIEVKSNAAPFSIGERAYIWGYGTERGEWILMTAPTWRWPDSVSNGFPLEWTTLTATQVIVGTLPSGVSEPHLQMANVGNEPLPVLTSTAWQQEVFSPVQRANPEIASWTADPDHDGYSNLVEYALGGEPLTFDQTLGLDYAYITEVGQPTSIELKLTRLSSRLAIVEIQLSKNLIQWSSPATTGEDHFTFQRVRLPWSTLTRQFVRLHAKLR